MTYLDLSIDRVDTTHLEPPEETQTTSFLEYVSYMPPDPNQICEGGDDDEDDTVEIDEE